MLPVESEDRMANYQGFKAADPLLSCGYSPPYPKQLARKPS